MKSFIARTAEPDVIVDALLNGDGAVKISGLFTPEQIADARAIVRDHSERADEKVTHIQGAAEQDGQIHLQRRVWNLLAKGEAFSDMATHPVLTKILRKFLGTEFIMVSTAANRILPGGPGQKPHVDYPHRDFHTPGSHLTGFNGSLTMNAQMSVILDPFSVESGATGYVPGSQKKLRHPPEEDKFYDNCARMIGEPGDVVLFYGVTWHCAMPDNSDHDSSAILIQYLPKWVKPMEDIPAAFTQSFIHAAKDDIRQLVGLDNPYPEVLDAAKACHPESRR